MESVPSLLLSLRGFSSPLFGKTLTDAEICAAMRRMKFKYRQNPIFHVKSILEFPLSASLRKMLHWFAVLCSDIHFCRMWYISNCVTLNSPFTTTIQDLMISLDQDLTIWERKLMHGSQELSMLRLYHTFRKYSSLFLSIVKMIESYISDNKHRKRCKSKPMRHPYRNFIGILSEIEILRNKASYAFDLDNFLLNRTKTMKLSVGETRSDMNMSLRLLLPSCQQPLFCHFIRNMLPVTLEFVLSHVFESTTQKLSRSASISADFFDSGVTHLSHWTPPNTLLWVTTVLLEYCKVDFDVLSRFRNISSSKEGITSENARELDVIGHSRIAGILKMHNFYKSDVIVSYENCLMQKYLLSGKLCSDDAISVEDGSFKDRHALILKSEAQSKHNEQMLQKINSLLQFVGSQQQKQLSLAVDVNSSSASSSERLWKHSFNMYPPEVFQKLTSAFETVNLLKQGSMLDKPNVQNNGPSSIGNTISFLHHTELIRRQVFAPLCNYLSHVKISAYRIVAHEFDLERQFQFIRNVFFLGKIDLLQGFKDLVFLLPIYHAAEASLPYRQYHKQHLGQSQAQWQSLSFTLEHAILEQKPAKGVQHFSVTMPSLSEAHRHRMLNTKQSSLSETQEFNVFDEPLLGHLISNLRYEMHYQWPVSMLFPASFVQRFQQVHQALLSMMSLKWLSEAWWKAIVPKGGLRQFHVLDRLRQRVIDQQNKQQKHSVRFGGPLPNRPPLRQPGDILDDMDTIDARDEEERLKQAQRNCQQAFIQVMHLAQLLSGYYLSRIHERVWPEVISKACCTSTEGDLSAESLHTIEVVQMAIRDGVEFIEDLLSIIEIPFARVFECSLKAFQELRQALSVEYSFVSSEVAVGEEENDEDDNEENDPTDVERDYYAELQRQVLQRTQTSLPAGKKQVQAHKKRAIRFSRKQLQKEVAAHREKVSRMLVAYRIAEIAFEDVNQAREAVMLAILTWRAGSTNAVGAPTTTPKNSSSMKKAKKTLARTPQSAWKMQQMQQDAQIWKRRTAIKQATKRLFVNDQSVLDGDNVGADQYRAEESMIESDDEEDEHPLQRAYSIDFLRCVEELQTQCTMLWTD